MCVHSSHRHRSAATVFVCVASIRSSICFTFFLNFLPSTSSIFSHHWIAWFLHLLLLSPHPPPSFITDGQCKSPIPASSGSIFCTNNTPWKPLRQAHMWPLHPPTTALSPPRSIRDSAAALPTGWAGRRPLSPATSRSCSGSPRAAPRAGPARSAGSCPRVWSLRSCSCHSGGCWTSRCSPAGRTPPPGSPRAVRRCLAQEERGGDV